MHSYDEQTTMNNRMNEPQTLKKQENGLGSVLALARGFGCMIRGSKECVGVGRPSRPVVLGPARGVVGPRRVGLEFSTRDRRERIGREVAGARCGAPVACTA